MAMPVRVNRRFAVRRGSGHATPVLAACIILVGCLHAAAAASPLVRISRVEAQGFPTVRCFVSVTDEAGESLAGLTADGFTVSEDAQDVGAIHLSSVLPGEERIAVILVLDRSGSMRGTPISAAKKAAADFARRLSEKDSLGIVSFASKVDPSSDLTTDRGAVFRYLEGVQPRGETAVYDAVRGAIAQLSQHTADRKAIVALTDGHDNASSATAAQCATAARRDSIAIYCVGLGRSLNADALRLMAQESGGQCFLTSSPESLTDIYRKIARQIQSQYVLTYDSPRPTGEGTWHTVEVSVHDKVGTASDRHQYLVPHPSGPGATVGSGFPRNLVYCGLLGFLLLDLLLVVAVIRRKARQAAPAQRNK